MIGPMRREPIRRSVAGSEPDAGQLADLLGRWSSTPGPLFRRLAARLRELTETGELPQGPGCPPSAAWPRRWGSAATPLPPPTRSFGTRRWPRPAAAPAPA
jgi:hypothetical protein